MGNLIVVDETIGCDEKQLPDVLIIPFNTYNLPQMPLPELYNFLEATKKKNLPTTGALSARKIFHMIKRKRKPEQEVLFIALARELSKMTEAFEEAAEMLRREKINAKVFDCGQAFASVKFFVETGLKTRGNLEKKIDKLEKKKQDIILFGIPNLKYVSRIGRIKGIKNIGTKLLDLLGFIPIFSLEEGQIKKLNICKKSNVANNLFELLETRVGYKEPVKINFLYGLENETTRKIKEKLKEESFDFTESKITKVVAINAGPQTIGFAFERRGYDSVDGEILINALQRFYEKIKKQRGILNLLNLFPVIDSDTGNNLEKTIRPLKKLENQNLRELLENINELTEESASGYSGTCMNAFFYGLFDGYEKSKGRERLTKKTLISMLKEAKEHAYLSFIKVQPVEGTILTGIRKTYEAFKETKEQKIERIFVEAYRRCVNELIHPDVRPEILRKKNIVDSGALGFSSFLEAFVEVLGREREIKEVKKKLQNTIKRQRMHLYYKPKEARTKGFCLELKVESKKIPELIDKLHVEEIIISHKKNFSLVHLHILPEERERVVSIVRNYGLINETPLSQTWYLLFKNQALMVGEKIILIPSFLVWAFYWVGIRIIWPFREMKLAKRNKKYKVIVKGLEKLIDADFAILMKDEHYSRGIEEHELVKVKESIKNEQTEEYLLRINDKSYRVKAIKEKEQVIGKLIVRENKIDYL